MSLLLRSNSLKITRKKVVNNSCARELELVNSFTLCEKRMNAVTTHASISAASPTWKNWSENVVHDGNNYYFKPTTKAELQSVLAQAREKGATVRVSGQRHSQPPLVATDNRGVTPPPEANAYLVDMSCYVDLGTTGMELGPGPNQVQVNPGIREDNLDAFLSANKLMLKTVIAGGFFSIGGMTAVDVNGATVAQPIFSETVSSFTIMGPDGNETVIDAEPELNFARVSLGALGIVTRMTIDVAPRPQPTTIQGGIDSYMLKDEHEFTDKLEELLTGPNKHDRMEIFYTPYAAAWAFLGVTNILVLWWDEVADAEPPSAPPPPDYETACELSDKDPPEYGAPLLSGLASFGEPVIRELQYQNPLFPLLPPPVAPIPAIAMSEIESQVKEANEVYSDLWLTEASRVVFMSYFVELPGLDKAGLSRLWQCLEVAADYATSDDSGFHFAGPMEFRFMKGGKAAMSGTYTTNPDAYFVNLDLLAFTEPTSGKDYPDALLKAFAHVERTWVKLGGLPHNGKMYGF